jgi:hypothetical protein
MMGFLDKMADLVASSPEKTVVDDARSRLARRDYEDRNKMQRVERDDEGNELLWFDVAITVGSHVGVPIAWSGNNAEEVNAAVIEWLNANEFITVDFTNNGAQSKMTFRTSFVAHWEIGAGRKRR